MSEETFNSTNEQSNPTFSFRDILESAESDDGMDKLHDIAALLSGRFRAGSKADVGTSVFGVTREVLDNVSRLGSADSVIALNRLDNFLNGVFGDDYRIQKAGVFAEFAVMKAIRDEVGCGIELPSPISN